MKKPKFIWINEVDFECHECTSGVRYVGMYGFVFQKRDIKRLIKWMQKALEWMEE